MSHTNSEFEFAPCLTVLTGPNNSGKSAVVEALQCLCGYGRSDYMVRHGEKETTVEAETGEGDVVQWRRIKGTPSFVINGVEHFRGEPEDLEKVLRLNRVPAKEGNEPFDVHFGEQKKPIFLLGESGARAATFFASSSDAQYLIQMQELHKQRTRDAKSDAQRARGEIKKLDEKLEALAPLGEIEPLLSQAEQSYSKLVDRVVDLEVLGAAVEILEDAAQAVAAKKRPVAVFESLINPPELKLVNQAVETIRGLSAAHSAAAASSHRAAVLEPLTTPPNLLDEAAISGMIDQLVQTGKRSRRLGRFVSALAALEAHPEYRDVSGLADSLGSLRLSAGVHESRRRRQEALVALNPLDAPRDMKPLTEVIARLAEAASGVAHFKRVLVEAGLHAQTAADQITGWARENETCPTCGAPVDADRMLARMEAAVG